MGTRGTFCEHGKPVGIEAVDDREHRLFVAAHLLGDGSGSFAAIGGQQDLAAAQHKGV